MRILVVEDEVRQADAICAGLREARITVDCASDGPEALDYTGATTYDAIVLDVMLPGVSGLEVCRQLRNRLVSTPILMLTARDSLEHKVEGLDAGADDYLTKPFAFAELMARLRALMRRESSRKSSVLQVANVTLDPARMQACCDAQVLDLTSREYQILEILMRQPGTVATRDSIIDRVWGFDYPGSSNLIEVHMSNLRRKLDEAGAPRLIETVRGVGYRLSDGPVR